MFDENAGDTAQGTRVENSGEAGFKTPLKYRPERHDSEFTLAGERAER
jgi:hypothetical protein